MRFDSKHRKNLSKALKGRQLSEDHKEKLRQAKLRNPVKYWLRKKRGSPIEATRAKLRMAHARRKELGIKRPFNAIKHFIENNPNKGKFGKEHPRYRENKKHPFHKLIRETYKYREWRTAIFQKDNYICVLCGKNGYIQADHYPIRFIDIIRKFEINTLDKALVCESLWDINNGRTLCLACHRKTNTWGRRKD